jgi:hypothetical protein
MMHVTEYDYTGQRLAALHLAAGKRAAFCSYSVYISSLFQGNGQVALSEAIACHAPSLVDVRAQPGMTIDCFKDELARPLAELTSLSAHPLLSFRGAEFEWSLRTPLHLSSGLYTLPPSKMKNEEVAGQSTQADAIEASARVQRCDDVARVLLKHGASLLAQDFGLVPAACHVSDRELRRWMWESDAATTFVLLRAKDVPTSIARVIFSFVLDLHVADHGRQAHLSRTYSV